MTEINLNKVAIVTDSVASLPAEALKQYSIRVIPMNIHFNGKTYRDGVDLSTSEVYRMLDKDPKHFTASPASIGECFHIYQEVALEARSILVITLSSKLSTTFNVANLARKYAQEQLPRIEIEVFNSYTAAGGEGLIVLAAARAAAAGKSLAEVAQVTRDVSARVKVGGVLKTIRYVYRTGRVPEISARLGSYLKIKPIFAITEGKVHIIGISRDQQKGIDSVINTMKQSIGSSPIHLIVSHADAFAEGEQLQKRLESEFNCVESWLTDFSPVMSYATGAGTLAISYYV